ncbi:unnamed protein product [Arctia plantaginis]|uniref:Uncharacterized protein n=1 Tax=Arctia plantaginis TaxID=874455 RepID=A0A8S1B4G1_ARCPL|nr:unnamed protein product [Arctia plantaginis]
MIIKALNLNTILWLGGDLMCVFVVCIPLVLMEVAFNDLDEIKIILVDELLTYKEPEHNIMAWRMSYVCIRRMHATGVHGDGF